MAIQKSELLNSKRDQQTDLKSAYDRATIAAREIAKNEMQQKRNDEEARIQAIKQAIARDNHRKSQEKLERNSEMNSTIGALEQRKANDWFQKVHDTSNKQQSQKLESERKRQKAELHSTVVKSKHEYNQDLTNTIVQHDEAKQVENLARRSRLDREGFQFE